MSMDAAVMDLSQVFEYGQGYVALSRVRRLSGLYLLGLNEHALKVSPDVLKKDIEFKKKSLEAEKVFGSLSADELKKMHENFVVACGGKISTSKSSRLGPNPNLALRGELNSKKYAKSTRMHTGRGAKTKTKN